MIDPKLLKENLSAISSNLKNKNYMLDKDEFLKIDSDRKELILENESLKNKKNLDLIYFYNLNIKYFTWV